MCLGWGRASKYCENQVKAVKHLAPIQQVAHGLQAQRLGFEEAGGVGLPAGAGQRVLLQDPWRGGGGSASKVKVRLK